MTYEMYLALTIAVCVSAFCLCFTCLMVWFVFSKLLEYLDDKSRLVSHLSSIAYRMDNALLHCHDAFYAKVNSFISGLDIDVKGVRK